ncbi:chemokine XC receptor 1-like [Trematomus bernacchii]|uniref:chemokine XC receptor 1-like n=1 Tax=Trematomus bernacchii TaxID=40690 RepID=UPI00146ED989|nr:chemokine XC receptor 1-like [Trematomus bernacchii]
MFPRIQRTMAFNNSTVNRGKNYCSEVFKLLFDLETFEIYSYILIFILSIIGNFLLLYVLFLYENLKNVTNLFVLNLACSDLMLTVTLPFWAVYLLQEWVFGHFACTFVIVTEIVGLYSSVILLTAMTVDRFITVVLHNMPRNKVRRQRFAALSCAAAWIISISVSIHVATRVTVEDWRGRSVCSIRTSYVDYDFNLAVSLLFFFLLSIIVFCYSAILKTVLQASNRRKHRTVVVVLCIVAAFIICLVPYNILDIIVSLKEPENCNALKREIIALSICQILAHSHCCMNPILYMLSEKWRKHLLDLFSCKKVRRVRDRKRTTDSSVKQNVAFKAQSSAVVLEPTCS